MKTPELRSATALALLLASPAFAQEAPADPGTDIVSNDEIVVTATKRETTLLDTPVSVSVTSAETIQQAQIRDLIDLQTVVPSLRVAQLQTSANTNFIIRGFGNGANNAGIEPSVGVFIDGVYRSRSAAQIADLPNLQRVEVLRGPQSTLFGKNASAGIISITTARPSFDFGGSLEATYGNYNAVVLKGSVTGPISKTIAFSLAANYNRRDGYAHDLALDEYANDRNRWGVRGQLLFEPSPDFSLRLIGDYDEIDENCCAVVNVINGPTGAAVQAVGGRLDPANPYSYEIYNNILSTNRVKNYGVSLQGDYALGNVNLTSITAFRGVRLRSNQDSDFTSADVIGANANQTDIDTFTQEVRLTSNFDGPFKFLIGGFYFNEKITTADQITFGQDFRGYANILSGNAIGTVESAVLGVPVGTFFQPGQGLFDEFDYTDESYSLFGQADFEPVDGLTFTAGLNYTDDRKRVSSDVTTTDAFSALDFFAIGNQVIFRTAFGQTLAGLGVNPNNPAAVQAFAQANPAAFAQVQAGAQAFANANTSNPQVNSLLALRALQFLPPFLNYPNAVESGRTNDDNLSYTLRVAYKFSPNLNAYATYATGFKASSFNLSRDSRPLASDFIPGSPATNPAASPIRDAGLAVPNLTTGSRFAGPEKASVYEVGLKAQFDKAAFNVAVFKQYIRGFQSNAFTGTGFSLLNADKESVFGVEFDGSVTPVEPLTVNLAVTYLDPKYDSFDNGGAINSNLVVGPANLTGTRPAGIPEWSVSLGTTFTQPLSDRVKLLVRTDYSYESAVQLNEGVLPLEREVKLLNGAATLQFDGGLEFSIWGRNLTNHKYLSTIFPSVAQTGSISGYPNQPRTYGATARFRF